MFYNQVPSSRLKFLVNDVKSDRVSSALHLGDQISQFLDRLDLLFQVFALKVVSQLSIFVLSGNLVKVQE